jgi:hypothetical protein
MALRLALRVFHSSLVCSIYNLAGETISEIKRLKLHLQYAAKSEKSNNTIHEKYNHLFIEETKDGNSTYITNYRKRIKSRKKQPTSVGQLILNQY